MILIPAEAKYLIKQEIKSKTKKKTLLVFANEIMRNYVDIKQEGLRHLSVLAKNTLVLGCLINFNEDALLFIEHFVS